MGFLYLFHLVIKYKEGIHNKVADMLSRLPTNASIVLKNSPLTHEEYIEEYVEETWMMNISLEWSHHQHESISNHMDSKPTNPIQCERS